MKNFRFGTSFPLFAGIRGMFSFSPGRSAERQPHLRRMSGLEVFLWFAGFALLFLWAVSGSAHAGPNASCAQIKNAAAAALCRSQGDRSNLVYCNRIADADLRQLCKSRRSNDAR